MGRTTTDQVRRLDVRVLATAARRQPLGADGTPGWIRWDIPAAPADRAVPYFDLRLNPPEPPPALPVFGYVDGQALAVVYQLPGQAHSIRQRFAIEAEPCHFGGQRLWVRCSCGRRARILYGPKWACRKCWDLRYPTERMSKADRMASRAYKIRCRLDRRMLEHHGFAMSLGIPFPAMDKPPRKWWSKFERQEEQLQRFEAGARELASKQIGRLSARARAR